MVDGLLEERRSHGGNSIGTTRKGIGPAYASKATRGGIRVGHLKHWPTFEARYRQLLADHQTMFDFTYDADEELER